MRAFLLLPLLLASCAVKDATGPTYYGNRALWTKPDLTWAVNTPTVPFGLAQQGNVDQAVGECFDTWKAAGVFRFRQAAPGTKPDILVTFRPFAKEDCRGAAEFPWSLNRGQIYLNNNHQWSGRYSFTANQLKDWLPHEIGHNLGLLHTSTCNSCMHECGPYSAPTQNDFRTLRRTYQRGVLVHPALGPRLR